MRNILLEVFLTIHGVAAASGLLFYQNKLVIISDNSDYLYQYHRAADTLSKTMLISRSGAQELVPKKEKADFEAIALHKKDFYIFGSGSGTKRNTLVKLQRETGKKTVVDMAQRYADMREQFAVAAADFNIEGAVVLKKELWLFNRGNGPGKKNGIFILDHKNLSVKHFFPIALPELQGVQTGFTDATLVDGSIYFIAAAEDSNSSYHDGEIKGTLIGKLNPKTKAVVYTQLLSDAHKFEGISLYMQSNNMLEFLLCEDQDNHNAVSTIYKVQIPK